MHPSRTSVALVACSSTSDVAGKYKTGGAGPGFVCTLPAIWRSKNWVGSGRRRSDFVVEMRISPAASN